MVLLRINVSKKVAGVEIRALRRLYLRFFMVARILFLC